MEYICTSLEWFILTSKNKLPYSVFTQKHENSESDKPFGTIPKLHSIQKLKRKRN